MSFDPNMTYAQSLKHVTKGLIQWPISQCEISELMDAVTSAGYYFITPVVRLFLLLTLPVSAPLVTLAVQIIRHKTARDIAKRKAQFVEKTFSNGSDA